MKRIFIFLLFLIPPSGLLFSQPYRYPPTTKGDRVDIYFGTEVRDPYQWLENDTAREVAEWVGAQNKITFDYLDKIPFRVNIKERLTKIWNFPKYSQPFREGKYYYFYKNDGLQNQSVLYIQKSLDAEPEVFLDPNRFSTDGTIALAGVSFSIDGKYAAYGLMKNGSDWRDIFVMDVDSREKLNDELKWVKFSGTSWHKNGFYYSRYDTPADTSQALTSKNEYHKVYYHELGTPQTDDVIAFEDKEHPLRLHWAGVSEDEQFLFLSVSESGQRGNAYYFKNLRKNDTRYTPITTRFTDQIYAVDNDGYKLILYTDKDAPNGKLILVDTQNPKEGIWKDLIPEKSEVLTGVASAGGKLFVTYMKDVNPHVYVYNLNGAFENEIELPILGTVGGFGGNKEDTFVFFSMTSYTTPSTIYRYDIASRKISLFRESEIDFPTEDYITRQVFYKSKDGTSIPMFITHKKNIVMDGTNPTILYGYGGFNSIMTPNFNAGRLIWMEQGGVYAVANLRGGSEYGENWHRDGIKLKKQNVFDDFIAAAEFLIDNKYSSPAKLAISGVSNGGLLVGAVTNQRPELFKVALPAVGVMDMLRFHKFTIGWSWTDDYGSSDDSLEFAYLYKYSPLHNVREGIDYPAILVTTADHDDRVVPAHSFKYIATIQEKCLKNNPALIRIETKAGHGGGKPTSKMIDEISDIYAFTFFNMGLTPHY